MTPELWQRVRDALAKARRLTGDNRKKFLEALRRSDPEAATQVESLLDHMDGEFLEHPAVPGSPLAPGTTIGPYTIQAPIGEGGMGTVYLATQARLAGRPVALKFLSGAMQLRPDARERLRLEANAVAALDHPYICRIYDTGEIEGRPFIAMEYVRGETLDRRMSRDRLRPRDALAIAREVAEALEAAHAAHIIHRDLKPSNVMLTAGGHVKVLDFGLARRLTDQDMAGTITAFGRSDADLASTVANLTQPGTVQGTIAYMSPEQIRAEAVDERSDIFAFGIVLYEMLAGVHPFSMRSSLETASRILEHAPGPPSESRSEIPPELDALVLKALAKFPAQRCSSVSELRMELDRVIESSGRETERIAPGPRPYWWQSLNRSARWSGAAVLALFVALLIYVLWPAPPAAEEFSVAVLPWVNGSGDPNDDYLSIALPSAIGTRFHNAGIKVRLPEDLVGIDPRMDPAELAQLLKVSFVLRGSFFRSDDRLQITPALLEGDFPLWTATLQQPWSEIFDMQAQIAIRVAVAVLGEMTEEVAQILRTPESRSDNALDLYYQGADQLLLGGEDGTRNAVDYFNAALEIDDELADAYVGLGAAYQERYFNGWGEGVADLDKSEDYLERGSEEDPGNIRALRGLARVHYYRGESEDVLKVAQRIRDRGRPDDLESLLGLGDVYVLGGLTSVGEPLLRQVIERDPLNQAATWILIAFSETRRDLEELLRTYLERFPEETNALMQLATLLEGEGRIEEAREAFDLSTRRPMDRAVDSVDWFELFALLHAGAFYQRQGESDRASELWRRGLELASRQLDRRSGITGLDLQRVAFLGYLGDPTFEAESDRARARLIDNGVNSLDFTALAAAHYAYGGGNGAAYEILETALENGLVNQLSSRTMAGLAPGFVDSPEFEAYRQDLDREIDRLTALYGPESWETDRPWWLYMTGLAVLVLAALLVVRYYRQGHPVPAAA